MSKGIRGTTQECLTHLGRQVPSSDVERGAFYKPIADFTRRSHSTVGRWFKGESAIEGESLLRLRYYLTKLGYQVSELEMLHPTIRELGRVIAEGKIEFEKAVDLIGIDRDQLYRTVLRGVMPLDDRLERIAELVKELGGGTSAGRSERVVTREVASRKGDQANAGLSREDTILSLACLIKAATPLAQAIVSDAFSAEDRQRLRDLAGKDGVYRLSTIMNRLCSEAARSHFVEYRG